MTGARRSLRGRCLSYGDGITFWPITEMIGPRRRSTTSCRPRSPSSGSWLSPAGRDDVAARIAPLLGLSAETFPLEETFWAVRSLFEGLARPRRWWWSSTTSIGPKPTLLDLLEHVREAAAASILIVASARPELIEGRADWGSRGLPSGSRPVPR